MGSAPSVHSMRIVSSGRSPVTTLRPACLDAACCLFTMHTVQAPLSIALSGSIHAASRAHVISRINARIHYYRCSAHATPEPSCRTRAPLDLGSAPQAPIISYIRPPLSLSQEARRDDPRHTLADNTYVLRFARPSPPLYTLYLFLPCSSLRDAVQSHSGSDPYYSPLRLETHGSI